MYRWNLFIFLCPYGLNLYKEPDKWINLFLQMPTKFLSTVIHNFPKYIYYLKILLRVELNLIVGKNIFISVGFSIRTVHLYNIIFRFLVAMCISVFIAGLALLFFFCCKFWWCNYKCIYSFSLHILFSLKWEL